MVNTSLRWVRHPLRAMKLKGQRTWCPRVAPPTSRRVPKVTRVPTRHRAPTIRRMFLPRQAVKARRAWTPGQMLRPLSVLSLMPVLSLLSRLRLIQNRHQHLIAPAARCSSSRGLRALAQVLAD